jgi:hypothetical protein
MTSFPRRSASLNGRLVFTHSAPSGKSGAFTVPAKRVIALRVAGASYAVPGCSIFGPRRAFLVSGASAIALPVSTVQFLCSQGPPTTSRQCGGPGPPYSAFNLASRKVRARKSSPSSGFMLISVPRRAAGAAKLPHVAPDVSAPTISDLR